MAYYKKDKYEICINLLYSNQLNIVFKMSFIKPKEIKTVFGVIVGNRDVFPDYIAEEGRKDIISVLKELGYE